MNHPQATPCKKTKHQHGEGTQGDQNRSIIKRCAFPEFMLHELRRRFASLHVSQGTSIDKVVRWLGDGEEGVESHHGPLIPHDDEIDTIWSPRKG